MAQNKLQLIVRAHMLVKVLAIPEIATQAGRVINAGSLFEYFQPVLCGFAPDVEPKYFRSKMSQ